MNKKVFKASAGGYSPPASLARIEDPGPFTIGDGWALDSRTATPIFLKAANGLNKPHLPLLNPGSPHPPSAEVESKPLAKLGLASSGSTKNFIRILMYLFVHCGPSKIFTLLEGQNKKFRRRSKVTRVIGSLERKSNTFSRAFTLLEILTVIAIIGVLTAILVPVVGSAMDSARKTAASNNLRQIAIAYYQYAYGEGNFKSINQPTLHDWAGFLAQKMELNDPGLWVIKEDPLMSQGGSLPRYIVSFDSNKHRWEINEAFRKQPLSISVVNGMQPSANPSTTPIAWTRGLQANGTWSSLASQTPGVYGEKGGFIAFLDGHVRWYSNLNEEGGQLVNYVTHQPTGNILEAIPPKTSILDYQEILIKNKNH